MPAATHSKVIVSATDKVSPVLKDIKAKFKAFSNHLSKVTSEFKGLASVSLAPLAGGIAAASAAIKSSIAETVAYGSAVDDASRSLGVATDRLQAFRYAATLGGSSAEEMDGALAKLNVQLAQAAAGKNKDVPELFEQMGIAMRDANGQMRTADDLLPEIADAIASQSTQAGKARIATLLFGKAGQNLIKTLNDGSAGLNNARKEAEKFGVIMDGEAVAAAAMFGDEMTKTRYAIKGVQMSIGSQLLPVLQPLLEQFNAWIASNREWIATTIAEAALDLGNALKEIDFKSLVTGTIDFIKQCVALFNAMGGIKTVAIAVAAIFAGKVAASLASTALAVGKLVSVGLTLGKAVLPVIATGIRTVTAAMLANPIGLIIAGIIGLITAGIALYRNWDKVTAFCSECWDKVVAAAQWAWDAVKAAWGTVSGWFGGIWQAISDTARDIFQGAVTFLTETAPGAVRGAWDTFKGWFGGLWQGISDSASGIFQGFVDFFTKSIPDSIKSAWEGLKQWFLDLLDTMLGPARKVIDTVKDITGGISDTASEIGSAISDKAGKAWGAVKGWFGGDDDEAAGPAPAALAPAAVPAPMLSEQRFDGKLDIRVRAEGGAQVEGVSAKGDNPAMAMKVNQDRGASR